jgi:hypothetical protein
MQLTTPVAILAGLVAIGVLTSMAVFLALRANHREEYERVASLPTLAALPAPSRSPVEPGPLPTSSSQTPPTRNLQAEAARALAEQHDALVEACWKPFAQTVPVLPSASYRLRMAFDANGKQAAKGNLVPPLLIKPEVAQCLALKLQPRELPAGLGAGTVDVTFTLP